MRGGAAVIDGGTAFFSTITVLVGPDVAVLVGVDVATAGSPTTGRTFSPVRSTRTAGGSTSQRVSMTGTARTVSAIITNKGRAARRPRTRRGPRIGAAPEKGARKPSL
jgi:hypothetical protein